MTKLEVIKQAYGEYWDIVKDFVNEDGYLWEFEEIGSKNKQMILEFSDIHLLKYSDVGNSPMFYIRPKCLKGIENNNGWTIVNEENVRNMKCEMYSIFQGGKKLVIELRQPIDHDGLIRDFKNNGVSHFMEIPGPLDPIHS